MSAIVLLAKTNRFRFGSLPYDTIIVQRCPFAVRSLLLHITLLELRLSLHILRVCPAAAMFA